MDCARSSMCLTPVIQVTFPGGRHWYARRYSWAVPSLMGCASRRGAALVSSPNGTGAVGLGEAASGIDPAARCDIDAGIGGARNNLHDCRRAGSDIRSPYYGSRRNLRLSCRINSGGCANRSIRRTYRKQYTCSPIGKVTSQQRIRFNPQRSARTRHVDRGSPERARTKF